MNLVITTENYHCPVFFFFLKKRVFWAQDKLLFLLREGFILDTQINSIQKLGSIYRDEGRQDYCLKQGLLIQMRPPPTCLPVLKLGLCHYAQQIFHCLFFSLRGKTLIPLAQTSVQLYDSLVLIVLITNKTPFRNTLYQ